MNPFERLPFDRRPSSVENTPTFIKGNTTAITYRLLKESLKRFSLRIFCYLLFIIIYFLFIFCLPESSLVHRSCPPTRHLYPVYHPLRDEQGIPITSVSFHHHLPLMSALSLPLPANCHIPISLSLRVWFPQFSPYSSFQKGD